MITLRHITSYFTLISLVFGSITPTVSLAKEPSLPKVVAQPFGYLRVKVVDGRTFHPLNHAQVVLVETGERYRTDQRGLTPWIKAPVLRSARFSRLVDELHGQLSLIAYKTGYRDSIHLGVRMNEGERSKVTIWQYQIERLRDTRVEPILFQEPYHRLWLIKLADHFRTKTELGEGYERPD
nr:hypothetical protein [Bacilli bacterium]